MNHLDLFSGIGGFHLAGEWVWGDDFNTVCHVEIDEFCQKVLRKHWPDVPIISDIRDVTHERILANTERNGRGSWRSKCERQQRGASFVGASGQGRARTRPTIDLLTGGFPCQPFSCAGKRGGKEDDRYLWPEMLRVIQEIRPTWIIGENVAGIINMELDKVLSDLEDSAYEVQPFLIPACGVDAPHKRDRVWIVAKSNAVRCKRGQNDQGQESTERNGTEETSDDPDTKRKRCETRAERTGRETRSNIGWRSAISDVADTGCPPGTPRRSIVHGGRQANGKGEAIGAEGQGIDRTREGRKSQSGMGRMAPRVSTWLDEPDTPRVARGVKNRVDRLKSLGNAIVPQVVAPIMQAIKEIEQRKLF